MREVREYGQKDMKFVSDRSYGVQEQGQEVYYDTITDSLS